ncbi:VanW family protein [Gorillibacterium sp. CAU 1737]|uniref:VanW family protein n=1 Tax=Gorillibacterium sp. CAU 1737 TaxID=3140362 RepID=UPI0032611104
MKSAILKRFPVLYQARVNQLRINRKWKDLRPSLRFASVQTEETFSFACKKHQSLLRRRLGASDPQLQENKVVNLGIASATIDGLLIRPGETFSFWNRIGVPSADKGYIDGLLLSRGEVKTGVGGGLCQLANLLYWMALHSPLEVVERHHHSFDPFPDDQRVLPFGSGASVFYNYIDLRLFNPTSHTFQVRVWLTEQHLKGALFCEEEWPLSYHIEERKHRFVRKHDILYRENEIWRFSTDKRTGTQAGEERLIANCAEVKYELPEGILVEEEDLLQSPRKIETK